MLLQYVTRMVRWLQDRHCWLVGKLRALMMENLRKMLPELLHIRSENPSWSYTSNTYVALLCCKFVDDCYASYIQIVERNIVYMLHKFIHKKSSHVQTELTYVIRRWDIFVSVEAARIYKIHRAWKSKFTDGLLCCKFINGLLCCLSANPWKEQSVYVE